MLDKHTKIDISVLTYMPTRIVQKTRLPLLPHLNITARVSFNLHRVAQFCASGPINQAQGSYLSKSAMPRATRSAAKASSESTKTYPYPKTAPEKSKDSKPERKVKPETKTYPETNPTKPTKSRAGKDSHLYTDDNPATTLHGTGFKDAATARHTIELVHKRSLLYQFQIINTMYYRAKHHPHSSNNKDMQAAMAVFRNWLDETYPTARDAQVDFKPLLRKDVVEKYLPRMRDRKLDTKWSEKYIELPKTKRLANVLVDDEKPGEADLAIARQDALAALMKETGFDEPPSKNDESLWDGHGDGVSSWHLKCIAYGWSPVKPEVLLRNFESSEDWKKKAT